MLFRHHTKPLQWHNIQENTVHFSARKVSPLDIRKKLLAKHERLGIICDTSDEYFNNLTLEEMEHLTCQLSMCVTGDQREHLKKMSVPGT